MKPMKPAFAKWIRQRKVALFISIGYGLIATLFWLVSMYAGNGDGTAAWLILYYAGWPVTWIVPRLTSGLENWLPLPIYAFLFSYGVVVAGMLWFYVIARVLTFIIAKLKIQRSSGG